MLGAFEIVIVVESTTLETVVPGEMPNVPFPRAPPDAIDIPASIPAVPNGIKSVVVATVVVVDPFPLPLLLVVVVVVVVVALLVTGASNTVRAAFAGSA